MSSSSSIEFTPVSRNLFHLNSFVEVKGEDAYELK